MNCRQASQSLFYPEFLLNHFYQFIIIIIIIIFIFIIIHFKFFLIFCSVPMCSGIPGYVFWCSWLLIHACVHSSIRNFNKMLLAHIYMWVSLYWVYVKFFFFFICELGMFDYNEVVPYILKVG